MTGGEATQQVRHRRPSPRVIRNRRILAVVAVLALSSAIVAAVALLAPRRAPEAAPAPSPSASDPSTPEPLPTPTFALDQYSIDDPTSLWVIANKLRPLNPLDYVPPDLVELDIPGGGLLRAEAVGPLQEMLAAYTAETGQTMRSISSFRSYGTQVNVYAGWVSSLGQEAADLTSARPGHSEHQTGWTMDMGSVPAQCDLDQCFGSTSQGAWLAANAWRYGFIIRYPDGYTPITGYEYEPWHIRYVGVALATEMHTTGVATLEEMFGLPAAPDYAG